MKSHLRIGGVPEHFNLPWQLAAEHDIFSTEGIDLSWTMYAGGTGAMTKALNNGELDVAILLTEGYMSAAHQGLQAKIAKVYIETPLVWGIYSGANSKIKSVDDVKKGRHAISRFGSGSHLMAMIRASQKKQMLGEKDFLVVNSLHGAVESLVKNETQLFFWEKFMTRPHVKSGELNLVGEFSAPWSSFLIIASETVMNTKQEVLQRLLQVMNAELIAFKQDNSSVVHIRKKFDMSMTEARAWLKNTQWNYDYQIATQSLINSQDALASIGICNDKMKVESLCAPWLKLIG
ncbi:MAG: ABC transporter substrate-binding protein [Flavobacteriales bacterium]